MTMNKNIGWKEVLAVVGLIGALYGGIVGIRSISADVAIEKVNEHTIQVEPKFDEIQREQSIMQSDVARIDERTKGTKATVDRIEEKLDRMQ